MLSPPYIAAAFSIAPHEATCSAVDRAAVRKAFAAAVPNALLDRQFKGDYTGVFCIGVARSYDALATIIRDGFLVSHHYIDLRGALAALEAVALGHNNELAALEGVIGFELWLAGQT
jgi:asparagine synthase (glutamine-hydrolysing)